MTVAGNKAGWAAAAAGGVVAAIGVLVMVGWLVPVPRLVQLSEGWVPTPFNVGIAFVLLGASLVFGWLERRWPLFIAASLLFALSFATLAQYLFYTDFGIDQLFVEDFLSNSYFPGRMAANTAALMTAGSAVLMLGAWPDSREAGGVAAWGAGVLFILASVVVILHLPGLDWAGWRGFKAMSLQAGVGTLAAGIGLLGLANRWTGRSAYLRDRRLGVVIFFVAAAIGTNLWQALASVDLMRLQAATVQAARSVEWQLMTGRAERYSAFRRLRDRLQTGGGRYTFDDWEREADAFIRDIPSLRSLLLVNADGEIVRIATRWPELVDPEDRIYTFDDARRELLTQALATGQLTVSRPLELRLGGTGFTMLLPFEWADGGRMAMVVGMSYREVFASMLDDAVPGYGIEIRVGDTLTFRRGERPARSDTPVQTISLPAPGADWRVSVWSLAGRGAQQGLLPLAVLALGLLSAFLVAVAFRYSMLAKTRLDRLLGEQSVGNAIWRESRDVLTTTDRSGRFVRVSDAARNLWGYDPAELEGQPFLTIVHPDDRERTLAEAVEVSHGKVVAAFTNRIVARDGRTVYTSWSAQWSAELAQMVSVGRDISSMIEHERALAASEERLRVAVRQTGRMVYDRQVGSQRSEWVGDSQTLLGIGLSALVAMSDDEWWARVHPSDRDAGRAAFAAAEMDGGAFRSQYRWLKRPGQWVWLEDAGGVIGDRVIGVMSDITEQREAEAVLERRVQQRTEELLHLNRELESFSYSVSHDLRTPLRAIAGFTEILREQYASQLDADGRHYLSRIETGAARMGLLIDDLLTLGRVSRLEIERQTVNLSDMATEILSGLQETEPKRVVDLRVEPGLTADCDPRLAHVVLQNLLGNAWKFTRDRDPAVIEFGTVDGAYYVRDNGVGFDMQYAGHLFGVFQRLHPIDEFPGTGIGLATVKRVIERHGGVVSAYGEVGQGASFRFTFD